MMKLLKKSEKEEKECCVNNSTDRSSTLVIKLVSGSTIILIVSSICMIKKMQNEKLDMPEKNRFPPSSQQIEDSLILYAGSVPA